MTDNEIIKALECRVYPKDSIGQTLYPVVTKLPRELAQQTFDLIERQRMTIDAAIAGQETLQKCIAEKDKEIEELHDKCGNCPVLKGKNNNIDSLNEQIKGWQIG